MKKSVTILAKNEWHKRFAFCLVLFLCLLPNQQLLSSTGEVQGKIVNAGSTFFSFEIFRILHLSHWADKPYGDTVGTPVPVSAVQLIDGMLTNWETAQHKMVPGEYFYTHNNRTWNQIFSTISTPNLISGEIVDVDMENSHLTVRYVLTAKSRVRHNPDQPAHIDSVFSFDPSMVIKYEGEEMDAVSAIQIGRHARVHHARKQTILAFTPEALYQDPWDPWSNAYGRCYKSFVQQGFFRGYYGGYMHFAQDRRGEWYNSFRVGDTGRLNLIGSDALIDVGPPMIRPGDRGVYASYAHPNGGTKAKFMFFRPSDDNSIEGHIVGINGNTITLEVVTCPTGEIASIDTAYVDVTLEDDAVYNIDGIRDQPKENAIQIGNYLKVLPEWTGAVLVRDYDTQKAMLDEEPSVKPYFIFDQMFPAFSGCFVHPDTLTVQENETIPFRVVIVSKSEDVLYQWYQEDKRIPGAQSTEYQHLAFMEDHGSEFTCVASGSYGNVYSPPIVLVVTRDTTELVVTGVSIADENTIQLSFNKYVKKDIAEEISNYSISDGITINSVTLIGDMKTVILKTSQLSPGEYEITVNNVIDLSEIPNQIADNFVMPVKYQVQFRYLRFTCIEKGSLTPRLGYLSFFANGGQRHGENASYFGTKGPEDTYWGFHPDSRVSLGEGDYAGVDLGPGLEIAPDSFELNIASAGGRDFHGWKIDASNDMENWILLYDGSSTRVNNGTQYVGHVDLSGLNPDDILTGAKEVQEIDFPQIPEKDISESPYTLQATASSGLPVSYYVISGPATLSGGNVLTFTDVGEVLIRATQEGDDAYYPAYPLEQTFTISIDQKLDQTIDFQSISSPYSVSSVPANITLSATASSGLPVSFSVSDGDATVSGNVLTVNSADTIEVVASQTGSDIYNAATTVTQSFIVEIVSDESSAYETNLVNFYPNPTEGKVFFSNELNEIVKVYNTIGELVKTSNDSRVIDFSNLPNGLYFIKLNGSISKVIKK